MKGKAVVFTGVHDVQFLEVNLPKPGEKDVVVDVKHSWISIGTESSFLTGERIRSDRKREENESLPFPMVAGYQKVGVISEVGRAVKDYEVGDHVFVSYSKISDMYFPQAGHVHPAVVDSNSIIKIPKHLPMIRFSPLVVAQVGYNCATKAKFASGETVIVIGDGLVAHWTVQTLLHLNVKVIVLGKYDQKMGYLPSKVTKINIGELAKDDVLKSLDFVDEVAGIIDTVGVMNLAHTLLPLIKYEGHWVHAGFVGDQYTFDIRELLLKEITLHTPNGRTPERMATTFDGITAGWLSTEKLITHRFPASEATQAWETILKKENHCLGVVLDW